MVIATKRIVLIAAIVVLFLRGPTTTVVSSAVPQTAALEQSPANIISASMFFTNASLSALPLDGRGNPMVNATLGISQTCSGYGKNHACQNPRDYYVVERTYPTVVKAWINATNVHGSPLRALKLNETLPPDWAITPSWGISNTGAIHMYLANTTHLGSNPDITSYSTITTSGKSPQIIRFAIPDFNKTAIGHPLLVGQSVLVSVTLAYALIGSKQSSVSYPKTYNDSATIATWNQTSFRGTEVTKNVSALFVTYGPLPVNVAPASNLWSVLGSIAPPIIGFAIILTIIFVVINRLKRVKQKPDFPNSRPLAA